MKTKSISLSLGIILFIACINPTKEVAASEDIKTDSSSQDSLFKALSAGKIDFSLRYRYEHVDDDIAAEEADALTLRSTLGYTTGKFRHLNARVLFQDVRSAGSDDFNDATGRSNAKTRFAVVADPSDSDFLESYVGFDGIKDTKLKLGRQLITYRKAPFHRFMGTILWRQNWQNHDAFTLENQSLPDTTIRYAYSWNINRIFTDKAVGARANFDSNSHLLNLTYDGFKLGKWEAYAYLLDFDNAAAFSTQTYGIRFNGNQTLNNKIKASYAAEYAHQSDYDNNPADIDAGYFLGQLGVDVKVNNVIDSLTLKAGYELLEGQGGADRFVTVLGTNHAFQGWADRFLITPGDGIQDIYISAIAKTFGARLEISYHDISSHNDSYDYGTELDLIAAKTFNKRYTVGVKYAYYNADNNATNLARNPSQAADVGKFWTWIQVNFSM